MSPSLSEELALNRGLALVEKLVGAKEVIEKEVFENIMVVVFCAFRVWDLELGFGELVVASDVCERTSAGADLGRRVD